MQNPAARQSVFAHSRPALAHPREAVPISPAATLGGAGLRQRVPTLGNSGHGLWKTGLWLPGVGMGEE